MTALDPQRTTGQRAAEPHPDCLCGHGEPVHHLGQRAGARVRTRCSRSGCGCTVYRPAPTKPAAAVYAYLDDTVQVELRATSYPYGAGRPGTGVQVTLACHDGRTLAVRLPDATAREFARAVLAQAVTGDG